MKPLHAAGLVVAGLALVGGGVALVAARRRPARAGGAATPDPSAGPADDPIVSPAYPYLDKWTADERRALLDLQRELGLDPRVGGLAGVIGHESGGDPAVPRVKDKTPRGGLIQVTVGARLPSYDTAEKVWAIRDQDRVAQLHGVVRDFYRRQLPHGPPTDQSAAALLRRNYLPGLASRAASFVLGVRVGSVGPGGEKPDDVLAPGLSLGSNYASNPGFDPAGRGWFTWEDVDRQAARAEVAAQARGWVRVSGARVPPGDALVAGVALSLEDARRARDKLRGVIGRPEWLTGGIGIGGSEIVVGVRELTDEVLRSVPPNIDGVPVRVETVGDVHALQAPEDDALVAGISDLMAGDEAALRRGWADVIAVRDSAPEGCPCRDATGPLIAEWEAYEAAPAARGDDALVHLWRALREARKIQSGAAGDALPGEVAIDVRERAEFATRPRADAENFPTSELDVDGLDGIVQWAAGRPVVVYCAAGVRAERVAHQLRAAGVDARNGHEAHAACRIGDPDCDPRMNGATAPVSGLWE